MQADIDHSDATFGRLAAVTYKRRRISDYSFASDEALVGGSSKKLVHDENDSKIALEVLQGKERSLGKRKGRSKSSTNVKHHQQQQLVLDFGQRSLKALDTCVECGMMYAKGNATDELVHSRVHKQRTEGIPFTGLKDDSVVEKLPNGDRVICISEGDLKSRHRKVTEIMDVVNDELGYAIHRGPKNENNHKIFLFLSPDSKVVGCLVAISITRAFRVVIQQSAHGSDPSALPAPTPLNIAKLEKEQIHPKDLAIRTLSSPSLPNMIGQSSTDLPINKQAVKLRVRHDQVEELACNSDTVVCCEKESVKAFLGIEQVWVHRKWRRRKIATRLLDAARAKFCYGYLVPSDLVAFSQPTQDGKVFAERYTCRKDFLVYDD